jgi:predicted dehydrogenase
MQILLILQKKEIMRKKINWGVIGPGRIARKFAEGLASLPEACLYAVASRSAERAEAFARDFGFERSFGSYTEMVADPALDVVYIATTNNLHFEHTMLCLNAGKAVLCEKPFASDRFQLAQMIACAREKRIFLMEALCTRFMPNILELKRRIEAGAVGKVAMLQCDFGFVKPFDAEDRVFNLALGGGSVPDIGIYPVFLALYLFGTPVEVKVVSIPAPTGADMTTAALFRHAGGEISMLSSSFATLLPNEARIYGDKGHLTVHRLFSKSDRLTFTDNNDEVIELPGGMESNGYNYEAAEVIRCLSAGLTESPAMPLDFSLTMLSVLDEITNQVKGEG